MQHYIRIRGKRNMLFIAMYLAEREDLDEDAPAKSTRFSHPAKLFCIFMSFVYHDYYPI